MKPVAYLSELAIANGSVERRVTISPVYKGAKPLVTEADAQREVERAVRVALAYAWEETHGYESPEEIHQVFVADVMARLKESQP